MIYLLLAILCSTSITLFFKWNDELKASVLYLLLGNYVVASGLGLFFYFRQTSDVTSVQSFLFGLAVGAVFVGAYFIYNMAVKFADASLATVSSRLSVAIPVILSILVFNEKPGFVQVVGLLFVLATLIFFYFSLSGHKHRQFHLIDFFYLFLLWLGIGLGDFSMKVFQTWRPVAEKPFFLTVIYSSAFFYTLVAIWWQRQDFDGKAFLLGMALGVPNMFSTYFLLSALNHLPAVVVYPVVNLGIILLTLILVYLIWKERLNTMGVMALISGAVAIVLLNL